MISAAKCERLQQSVTYTQEEAPRDLSGVVSGFDSDTCQVLSFAITPVFLICTELLIQSYQWL